MSQSVCKYKVIFSDGTVMYPNLPGHVDVYTLAAQYARETLSKDKDIPITVSSVEFLY